MNLRHEVEGSISFSFNRITSIFRNPEWPLEKVDKQVNNNLTK